MKKVTLINHWAFRLLTPPIFAIFIYVLVLLFFGSASKLSEHFFSIEYLICVLLCYANFELWHLAIVLCSRICKTNPWRPLIYQSIASVIISLGVTTLLVSMYFKYFVGLINYSSELYIFVALFIFSSLLYQMVYLSIFLQNYQHQDIINKQKRLKKEADDNWVKFQNKINPPLLYQSLETLIGLVHNKHENAEELITQLSAIYRKILDHNDDIINLAKEIDLLKTLNKILPIIYENRVKLLINQSAENMEGYLIPGYLLLMVQRIIYENIVSTQQPLYITLFIADHNIKIKYKENNSLKMNTNSLTLKAENEQIAWYTKNEVVETINEQGEKNIAIPIINIEN